jgi:hypothetical protein
MKRIALLVIVTNFALFGLAAQQLAETRRAVDYSIRDSVDNVGNLYIRAWSTHPSVLTFVNGDGSVTVCSSDENAKKTYMYEYDINLKEQKELTFQNELGSLGAFTKDNDGNYYFFYAVRAANQNAENMAMVKYNKTGEKILSYKLKAQAPNSFGGIRVPYDAGSCKLELSGSMLAVYFAREMFNGHQASYGFVLDKDSFERVDIGQVRNNGYTLSGNNIIPYTSHSFNQFILPVDNGFVFADHGDAYPRAFTFGKFQNGSNTKRVHAFAFPGGTGVNATYAEMGSLAETSSGYIFTGVYRKDRNNPRNLFVLTFDEDFKSCSAPIYLTKYTKENGHAGHPKIVAVGTNRYLVLWEMFKFSTQAANVLAGGQTEYLSTYMMLIDEKGAALSEPRELEGIRLNMNDTLRYNPRNGKTYWAINDSNTSIKIYALGENY